MSRRATGSPLSRLAAGIPETVGPRVLIAAVLTGTLSVLDSTIVVPLLGVIGDQFDAGTAVSWLVAAYLIASTATMPLWGRYLDLRGERAALWSSLLVFALGTVMAMVAPTLLMLILARVVQGIGAGGLVPIGQAVLSGRCTAAERARLQVHYSASYAVAAGLGPLVGGVFAGVSWRLAFAVILPFVAIAFLLTIGKLSTESRATQHVPFDWKGSVLLCAALTVLLLGIERTWWPAMVAGALLAFGFAIHALRLGHGLIPAPVLRNRRVLLAGGMALLIGFTQFAMLTYLPGLAGQVAPGINTGIVVVPLTVLWMTLGAGTGRLALTMGARRLGLIGIVMGSAAGALVALAPGSMAALLAASGLTGAAAGFILIPTLLVAQHATVSEHVGSATSIHILLRNFGGAAGAAITAVLISGAGASQAFAIVAAITALGLVPALMLPRRGIG